MASLDMTLDDMIKSRRNSERGGRGQGRARRGRGAGGSYRGGRATGAPRRGPLGVNARPSAYTIAKTFRRTKNLPWQNGLFEDSLRAAGLSSVLDSGTKLYVSNLDIGVTNEDIRELFSEMGELVRFAIHYDKNGRPSGAAEVVFARRSDAFQALKRYNNVQLDGKPMKIEIIGSNPEIPLSARVNIVGGTNRRRTVVMAPGGPARGRGGASSRGSSQRGRGGLRNAPGRGRGGGRGWGRGRVMSLKLHHHNLPSYSSSSPWPSVKAVGNYYFSRKVVGLDHLIYNQCNTRRRCHAKFYLLRGGSCDLTCISDSMKHRINPRTSRILHLLPFASAEDGVSVNGSSRPTTSSDMEEMRLKLDLSLQVEENGSGLVQSLHDAARVIELGLRQQSSLSRLSWFSTAWLGGDRTGWIKVLSYQASVYSLLQAANEILSRGDERDNDINVFTQRSLSRQSAPLESLIRDSLLAKQPEAYDWFWSEQIPAVVTTFVNYFEKDQRFAAATAETRKQTSLSPRSASDISFLMLALSCIAAILKLGAAKLSCTQFSSLVPDTLGRLMDMLVEFIPLRQAYHSVKPIGLRREFLVHFGPRAAACRVQNDSGTEEVVFWVSLVQKQLQRAIDRERIWSRLTTSESIEVLEKDLAIFGFFIALGRSTKAFLSENGFDTLDEPIEELIRYLIGGSVLYYPQLASISSYQLYVEVVCEELDWLPFYPGITANSIRNTGHKSKQEVPPNLEAIPLVIDVCSYWIQSFIKYSKWLEDPSHVKAARFLSTGHNKLKKCREDLGIEKTRPGGYSQIKKETDSFDKALESVEEALVRLEELLQELHMSSASSQKEHLKAACSDLERIRRIKKEAEFLEVSFRTKAAFLQQEEDATMSTLSSSDQQQISKRKDSKDGQNRSGNNRIQGLWSFVGRRPSKSADQASSTPNDIGDDGSKQPSESTGIVDSKSIEVRRFELLRSELMELEKRVQRSADQYEYEEEESQMADRTSTHSAGAERTQLVLQKKKESVIEKSLDKLKETSTDVWQGTQLLAIDVAAALGLLRRSIVGDELTDKEKQALRRTLTDLASVVPIGFLMLLPVTAVGHAAMLAAIQRYMPSLIPSTYGPDRLDLLRQLEKVKEMETEVNPTEKADE